LTPKAERELDALNEISKRYAIPVPALLAEDDQMARARQEARAAAPGLFGMVNEDLRGQ